MRILILFASVIASSTASTSKEMLTSAMKQAISNIKLVDFVGERSLPVNGDSIEAQNIGEIMQETTRIIIRNHGANMLSQFKNIDILAILGSQLKAGGRKNGAGTNTTSCINRSKSCNKSQLPYRSISGWCNNVDTVNRARGAAVTPLRRFMGAAKYDDGFNSVRRKSANGGVLPSTRAISNTIFAEASIPSFDHKYGHILMQYGQWIAHDIISTPPAIDTNGAVLDCSQCESANLTANCAPIEIPVDDEYFPAKTDSGKKACIRLTRAINGQTGLGPRAQINQNTHFLDLSQVYGSTDCVAKELRSHKDGRMKMYSTDGYNLPPRTTHEHRCKSQKENSQYLCFNAGDNRNSLHPGLIPMHTIYLRQHNKWAAQMKSLRPSWTDEKIYQETRRLMISLYQFHVYSEYLPKIIGEKKLREFNLNPEGLKNTYDNTTDPSVSAEFSTAAFRFGHSMARRDIPRKTSSNVTIGSYIDLGKNIYYTDTLYDKAANASTMTHGMVNCPAMAVDRQFSFPMRNEIHSIRGKKGSGIDLPATNVQRAREMGVHPYNEIRAKIPGLSYVSSFDELKTSLGEENVKLLKQTYARVNDVDLYVGLLMEKRIDPTALLGPTGSHLIADQFSAFKKGDRFFYENNATVGALLQAEFNAIRNYPLAHLICENTHGMELVQADIFQYNSRKLPCSSFPVFPMNQILRS